MPRSRAVDLATRANTWVWTATLGTPSPSSSDVNPTTVGLQELQSPTPRMAALPSAAIFLRMSRSSTQLSLGDNRTALATLDQAPSPFKLGAGVRMAHGGLAAIALDLILAAKCNCLEVPWRRPQEFPQ